MLSYTKEKFFKNNNKIIQLKYHSMNTKNQIKQMMPLTIVYHGLSITSVFGEVY